MIRFVDRVKRIDSDIVTGFGAVAFALTGFVLLMYIVSAAPAKTMNSQTNAFANAFNMGEKDHMTQPRKVYPPFERPTEWGGGDSEARPSLIPELVQGNSAHIEPGKKAVLLKLESVDSDSKVRTISVFPLLKSPNALWTGNGLNSGAVPLNGDWSRFSVPHRIQIDYGVGGQGSESVFIDLRRGFKVALPFSSVTVTAFNVFNPTIYSDPLSSIDVGLSIAEGNSSDNDGLEVSAVALGVAGADAVFFGIPPHAKDFIVYAGKDADAAGAAFTMSMDSFDIVLGVNNTIAQWAIPQQKAPAGPFTIPGDMTRLLLTNNEVVPVNYRVVWRLNI